MEDQEGEHAVYQKLKLGQESCLHCIEVQLIKALEEARGNGTSMISLIMPPKDQVCMAPKYFASTSMG